MDHLDVLLVASDPEASIHLIGMLQANGCQVHAVAMDEAAPETLSLEGSEVVLLHLDPEAAGGLAWCRDLRRRRPRARLCVLFETALAGEIAGALELGADAVLCRPVSETVLLAQLTALARHTAGSSSRTVPAVDLVIDLPVRSATLDGRPLPLTDAEFDLLALLGRHAGIVLTRDAISIELRGHPHRDDDRSIDLRVVQLRRKVGDDARRPRIVKAVRGLGYLLAVRPRVLYEIDT